MSYANTQVITGQVKGSILLKEGRLVCAMGLPIDGGAWYGYRTRSLTEGYGKVWRVGLAEPKCDLGVPAEDSRRRPVPAGEAPSVHLPPDALTHEDPAER